MKKLIFVLAFFLLPASRLEAARFVRNGAGSSGCSNGSINYNPTTDTCGSGGDTIHLSIAQGIAAMGGGTTLNIRAGTYSEDIGNAGGSRPQFTGLPPAGSGSGNNYTAPTIIQAYNNEFVQLGFFQLTCGSSPNLETSYVIFKDMHSGSIANNITGGLYVGACGGFVPSRSIHHIKFDGMEFQHAKQRPTYTDEGNLVILSPHPFVHSIWITGPAPTVSGSGALVYKSKFHGTGCGSILQPPPANRGAPGYLIYQESTGVIVENTEFYDGAGNGIQELFTDENHTGNARSPNIYRNNWFHNIGNEIASGTYGSCDYIGVFALTIGADSPAGLSVNNNLFTDARNGINITGTTGAMIYNNTFSRLGNNGNIQNCSPDDCYDVIVAGNVDGDPARPTNYGLIKNNLLWNNGNNSIFTGTSTTLAIIPNYTTPNPNFVSPGPTGEDYRLQFGSTAIDFGVASICTAGHPACPSTSVTAPFLGLRPDAGAYESGAVAPPVVTVQINIPASDNLSTGSPAAFSGTVTPSGTPVTWSNNRIPLANSAVPVVSLDSATVTGTTWSALIPLLPGVNTIVINAGGGAALSTRTVVYAPTFPGNTLAGAWAFEAITSSINLVDSSGNNNTGTLSGSPLPTLALAQYGNGVSFPGTNQYVNVANANSLQFTQSFTWMAWVKPAIVATDYRTILAKDPVYIYASSDPNSDGCLNGAPMVTMIRNGGFFGSTDYTNLCFGSTALNPGQFSHIAMTYSTLTGFLTTYLNGAQISQVAVSGYMEPTTSALTIGKSEFGEWFNGIVDEPKVYNFALPRTAGNNTIAGGTCQDRTQQNAIATASIVGGMNCSILAPTPPANIKFPASATGLKVGTAAGIMKFGTVP